MLLGTNDLTTILAIETGSEIQDLCHLLYESQSRIDLRLSNPL